MTQNIRELFSAVVRDGTKPTVTPKGIEIFRGVLNDWQRFQAFLNTPRQALDFLIALSNSGCEASALAVKALAARRVVWGFAWNGRLPRKTFDLIKAFPAKGQSSILSAEKAIQALAEHALGRETLDLIKSWPDGDDQAATLAMPGVVPAFADNDMGTETFDLITTFQSNKQARILATPLAIGALARVGLDREILALIDAWPRRDQAVIQASPLAADELENLRDMHHRSQNTPPGPPMAEP